MKTKKTPIVLSIVFGVVSFILTICLLVCLYEKPIEQSLSTEDFNSYFVIDSYKSEFKDETLIVYLSVEELTELDLEFKSLFTVRLFYNNTNGSMSEVSYVNREITYDGNTNEFMLELKPKKALVNFESYNGFEISYQIVYMGIRGEE